MELQDVINSPGLWMASSVMVIAVFAQGIIFLRAGLQEAKKIGMERERYMSGFRSAIITAIGPSLSPVIVLLALIAVIGAPTTWMRLNDVGAARTELAVISICSTMVGAEPGTASFDLKAFDYSLWGMALNNVGWLIVVLLTTHRMSKIVEKLYVKYDPKWIRLLMGGTIIGLVSFLLCGQFTGPLLKGQFPKLVAAAISGGTMLFITRALTKHQRLQEVALGIAMVTGMLVTQAIYG